MNVSFVPIKVVLFWISSPNPFLFSSNVGKSKLPSIGVRFLLKSNITLSKPPLSPFNLFNSVSKSFNSPFFSFKSFALSASSVVKSFLLKFLINTETSLIYSNPVSYNLSKTFKPINWASKSFLSLCDLSMNIELLPCNDNAVNTKSSYLPTYCSITWFVSLLSVPFKEVLSSPSCL